MSLMKAALKRENQLRPPVWFMRQAGRYHAHYQNLRKQYSFIELCKKPEVACEATLGPIRDFDFDSAILFSDLLFPLEVMGMGLRYDEGPKLDWHLREIADLAKLMGGAGLVEGLRFQADALKLIRKALPLDKTLLGFVGGPLTLFCYAVEGSHQGNLDSARAGLTDGRFAGFFEKLLDLLVENMVLQAEGGADAVAILDTCAGEFDFVTYQKSVVPYLKIVMNRFKERCPDTPIVYYSKGTGPDHWESLKEMPIACLGVDWRHDLAQVLTDWTPHFAIQGNIDPNWLFLEAPELETRLRAVFESVKKLPAKYRQGWVCGLGHGVLPRTPESNVRLFLRLQKELFSGEYSSSK
jgi:uroporphyrinogen decarboxylase